MGFWENVLSTLIGALVGAFAGASIAYLFSRNLRNQQRADELEDWRAEDAQRHHDRLNERVTAVVNSLTELAAALEPTSKAGNRRDLPAMPRQIVLQNLLIAQMVADEAEFKVLEAAWLNVSARNWPDGRGVQNAEHVSRALLDWRRGELSDRRLGQNSRACCPYAVAPPGEEW